MTGHYVIINIKRCIGLKWPMTQIANSHLDQSQMANSGLLRPVMSPVLKSPP